MSRRQIFTGLKNNGRNLWPLCRYLFLRTETHAFCLALAAAALLGFYPFCALLLWLTKNASMWLKGHSPGWVWWDWSNVYYFTREAIYLYIPTSFVEGRPVDTIFVEGKPVVGDFLIRNLVVSVEKFRPSSILWILLGAAGVFVPLEAAFNRLWKAEKDRSYWHNQAVGFALTLVCCFMALAFVAVNATVRFGTGFLFSTFQSIVGFVSFHHLAIPAAVQGAFNAVLLRIEAAAFFSVVILIFYKALPNTKVRLVQVLPAALLAGLMAQLVQTTYGLALPFMDIRDQNGSQGPLYLPVNFLLLTYFETFVVLGGAFLATQTRVLPKDGVLPALALPKEPTEVTTPDERGAAKIPDAAPAAPETEPAANNP